MKCIAKTFQGLEPILFKEILDKGFNKPEQLRRAVSFTSTIEDLYRANYSLSTALRILTLIKTEKTYDEDKLYLFVYSIPWHTWFSVNKTFRVDVTLVSEKFKNSLFLAQKAKDAIVDRFRKEKGLRPSVDTKFPDVIIHLHITDKETQIFMDSSGETLNRRNYRRSQGEAPINEVLARGLIKLCGWKADKPLLDIMCGSGTIPTEALYEACNIPSGYLRNSYSFMHWNSFDANLWEKVKQEENNKIKACRVEIIGLDINKFVLNQAKKNIQSLPYANSIKFEENDFIEQVYPFSNGLLLSNIPYDERIKVSNVQSFYHNLGTQLKFNYRTNEVWLFMKKEYAKHISLKPNKKIPLLNGSIECVLNYYKIY